MNDEANLARRRFLAALGLTAASASLPALAGSTLSDAFADFFQQHYRDMTRDEIDETLARIERQVKRSYGVDIDCKDISAIPGVVFGYAINISKCRSYRACVHACVKENNLSRDTQYIRVLEMHGGSLNLNEGDHYYDSAEVPHTDRYYLPMQCM
jgi:molybdopterin-containing oxidoreductase family iron-sulfur binding subunit